MGWVSKMEETVKESVIMSNAQRTRIKLHKHQLK